MGEFVAGFASRHAAAGDALARAFAAASGFTAIPVAPAPPASRGFAPEPAGPRHFSPADPDRNPTEGWDPFDTETPVEETFVDPIAAARAAGYAEGVAATLADTGAAGNRDRAMLLQLADALTTAAHIDRDAIARRLRQTVLALVTRLVGEIGVSGDRLAGRIEAATDLLADGAESALLRMHPDDVPLVDGKLPHNIFPVGDAAIERGGFVLESASTIVEDGPTLWLDQLGQAIDCVAVPSAC